MAAEHNISPLTEAVRQQYFHGFCLREGHRVQVCVKLRHQPLAVGQSEQFRNRFWPFRDIDFGKADFLVDKFLALGRAVRTRR